MNHYPPHHLIPLFFMIDQAEFEGRLVQTTVPTTAAKPTIPLPSQLPAASARTTDYRRKAEAITDPEENLYRICWVSSPCQTGRQITANSCDVPTNIMQI